MAELVPVQIGELCPLNTRLLPSELCQAFGIADDSYDSREILPPNEAPPQRRTEVTSSAFAASDAAEPCVGAAQQQPQAHEQQAADARFPPAGAAGQLPASTQVQTASGASIPAATAPTNPLLQAHSASQKQQATSSISAGVQQQPAMQAAAAVVGGPLRGITAAYINPHSLLPYAQQTVAALPHLSGALPVTMYSPANISAVVALQQQQQQQQQQLSDAEAAEELQTRALKRPRLVWTPKLHKLFEEAVQKIGVNKAVPKTIMQLMNVEGLTRENVASHLQKYRLSLRKGPDGFISTATEGTETSGPQPCSSSRECVHKGDEQASAEQPSTGAAATAPAPAATTTTGDMISADPASAAGILNQADDTAGDDDDDGDGAAAAAEGVSNEAGTGAVAESRGDREAEAEANAEPEAEG